MNSYSAKKSVCTEQRVLGRVYEVTKASLSVEKHRTHWQSKKKIIKNNIL